MASRERTPRDLWSRLRSLGRRVEEEIYDFTEEDAEREEEPRGRNTLVALLNGFFTMWRATQASSAEQINQALVQLSEAAQQTVESLQQSSQAIDELNVVSNELRNGVSRFKVTD